MSKKSEEEIQTLLGRLKAGELKSNTKEYSLAYYYLHRKTRLIRDKELYHSRHKAKKAEYRIKHKDQKNDYLIQWRKENSEYMSKYMKRRRKEHPGKVRTEERLKELNRKRPNSKLYELELEQFYSKCPENQVVDHIIPLQGKNVSGLNVTWNLQYLSKTENNFKRHSFDGTYENDSWKIRYKKHYK